MSRRQLFQALCKVADALEQETARQPCTAHTCVLAGLIAQLDRLIDAIVQPTDAQAWGWCDDE
jgi:hypothetical protein